MFDLLVQQIFRCTKCVLSANRINAVPGSGPLDADLMFVGEAPGAEEGRQGLPFVGTAGKLLTELLGSIGVSRSNIYITNVVKCRPPGNRAPKTKEIATCVPYLHKQISLIKPKVICTLGSIASKALIGKKSSISKDHGKPKEIGGIFYLPLYHPAASLHNPPLKQVLFEDMKILKELIEKLIQVN